MGSAIALREDFDGAALRRFAKTTKDAVQSRRLPALAEIYDSGRRLDGARIGGVGRQVIRDWVLRFKVDGQTGLVARRLVKLFPEPPLRLTISCPEKQHGPAS